MGDRCRLTMRIKKQDEQRFLELHQGERWGEVKDLQDVWDEIEEDEKEMVFTMYEANYALQDERGTWAKEIDFDGYHGEGGNYGAMEFVALDGVLYEADKLNDNLVVPVDPLGDPIPEAITNVKEYLEAYRQLQKKWEAT